MQTCWCDGIGTLSALLWNYFAAFVIRPRQILQMVISTPSHLCYEVVDNLNARPGTEIFLFLRRATPHARAVFNNGVGQWSDHNRIIISDKCWSYPTCVLHSTMINARVRCYTFSFGTYSSNLYDLSQTETDDKAPLERGVYRPKSNIDCRI